MRLPTLLVLIALRCLTPMTNCFLGQPTRMSGPVPLPGSGGIGLAFEVLVSALAINAFSRLRIQTTTTTSTKTPIRTTPTIPTTTTTTSATTTKPIVKQCQPGYLLYSENCDEFCYRYDFQNCKPWLMAQTDCLNEGSNLYAPSNCSFSFFQKLAAHERVACTNVWIGATTTAKSVPFQTVLGDTIPNNSPFWGPGEPSGIDGNRDEERCASLSDTQNYFMNDEACFYRRGFICQNFK